MKQLEKFKKDYGTKGASFVIRCASRQLHLESQEGLREELEKLATALEQALSEE